MSQVLVIGAGVIGLQTAVTLLSAGYKVIILAEHFPGDESIEYTSPWAGAIWRTHSAYDQVEMCEWDLESYREWMTILDMEPGKARAMGIEKLPIQIYTTNPTIDTSSPNLWFHSHVQDFSPLHQSSLPQAPNILSGYTYSSIVLNPPKYLSHLLTTATSLGAKILHAHLPTTTGLATAISTALHLTTPSLSSPTRPQPPIAVVINCAGLGAHTLCPDPSVYPIRGQTLLARITPLPPSSDLAIRLHEDPVAAPAVTYCFPRPGTDLFVLGGTKAAHDWSSAPDATVSKEIVERCKMVWPEIADARVEIVGTQVGLRPGRKGGVRVEREDVVVEGERVRVVHQYGHAGAGYQLSIGSARKVLEIVGGIVGEGEDKMT
ncbi:FAD dependent oxidoreductase [Dendryphion nanum]|uniref:FAD dependent oxidoreductase n=1 Tax=Dendryphion nanum TaxID=256645 RepID=A0A9P9IFC0_9PLEO|nr:FAD dependent oxidoreductase [Dendryphion nanum]